tara:strand:- start:107 stop:562 length:456 start_codon:yes stop_codon:yes gene_type:complete
MARRRKTNGRKVNRSPMLADGDSKSVWTKPLDYLQTAGDVVGLIPGVGNIVDGVNAGISGARAGYALSQGDNKSAKNHGISTATRAFQAIPGTQAITGAKLANAAINTYDTVNTVKMVTEDANQAINNYNDFKNKKNNKLTSADAETKTIS